MDLLLTARAVVLGFTIAAAVGPISLLTIRRTLEHGRLYGLASGLGVATADATYAAVAALGLTAITNALVGARPVLGVVGGAVIVYLGLRTLTSPPNEAAPSSDRLGLVAAFVSIYGLTLTNPMTILSFAALFAALGAVTGPTGVAGASAAIALVIGIFVGSSLWWAVLTSVVGWLRTRVTISALRVVNGVSGLLLVVFGCAAAYAALMS